MAARPNAVGLRVALADVRGRAERGAEAPAAPTRATPLGGRTNLVSGIQILFVPR
jgi:hypothetical protein